MKLDGVLVIDKPVGPTSHDVVAEVKRLIRADKVGHLGTLDPAASGVLPLVINKATKLASKLAGDEKVYEFTLCIGVATDTDDDTGKEIVKLPAPSELESKLRKILPQFTGSIMQRPPKFSAKKVRGTRSYALARKGEDARLEPRPVVIESLEIIGVKWPELRLKIRCQAGTYVRSLCRDLGEAIGSCGHAKNIRRLQSGPYTIDQAISLESLRKGPFPSLQLIDL